MRFKFVIVLVVTLLILVMLFNGISVGVSGGVSDPLGLVGLYAEYECPPVTFINKYGIHGFQSSFPPAIFLAKYYKTDFYKSIIDKWGDDIIKFNRGKRDVIRDPFIVAVFLEELADNLYDRGYTVRYNLSFHVVGFDGEYYDVVLRLKISIVNIKNLSIVLYESPYVEERVKVSMRDRSMLYKGSYAGVWPFFLLPWEVYEGNNVTISELILYDIFKVEQVIDRMEATLKPESLGSSDFLKRLWESRERYFREVVGITVRPENTLTAKFWLNTAMHADLIKQKWGDIAEFIKRWVDAKDAVAREFYESLGFTHINLYIPREGRYPTGVGTHVEFKYDVKSGVAYIFVAYGLLPDVLSYIFPIEPYTNRLPGSGCSPTWYLTSLKYITPESTRSPEATVPHTTAITDTSTGTTTTVREELTVTTATTTTIQVATTQTDAGEARATIVASPTVSPTGVEEAGALPRPVLTRTPTITPLGFVETPAYKSKLLSIEFALITFAVAMVVLLVALSYRFLRR